MFLGDYHIHTKFSDGRDSVLEVAFEAQRKGLSEIAITDHGFHIPTMSYEKFLKAKKACREAEEKTGIKVYAGVEANIISTDGDLDVPFEKLPEIEYLIAGFHKFAIPKNVTSFFEAYAVTYFNGMFKTSEKAIRRNTRALLNVIERYPVRALAHINHSLKVDVYQVASACREKGVLVELNAKHLSDLDGEWEALIDSGADFVLNSDAHRLSAVGDLSAALEKVLAQGIEKERIVNYIGE